MSLRRQLLALAALMLLLPWAGLRFLEQSEESLRRNHEAVLLAVTDTAASLVAGSDDLESPLPVLAGAGSALYAPLLAGPPPRMDGSRDDWRYANAVQGESDAARAFVLADGSRIWLAAQGLFLFFYADVVDDEYVPQRIPGQAPHGDRIVLLFGSGPRNQRARLLVSTGPGFFSAQQSPGGDRFESTGEEDATVPGYLVTTSRGYAVEARIPLGLIDRSTDPFDGGFGVGIIDSDDAGRSAGWAAATWRDTVEPGALILQWPELERMLGRFEDRNYRFRILDRDGWVLADTGPLNLTVLAISGDERSATERLFRYALRREDPPYASIELRPGRVGDPALLAAIDGASVTAWYGIGTESRAVAAAAVPIAGTESRLGALLLEQTSDPVLTLGNEATQRLLGTTALGILIVMLALLAYAGFLSFRIRRLARAAESALGPRGEIDVAVPGIRARDEIGSLARSFADLLGRLRDYTDYLQSLKSKLSHELRTPLAIVATSLDNLEQESGGATASAYLARLRQGASRLESILQSMTAATRVEQAITQTAFERFDLAAVVSACVASYRDVYAGQAFNLEAAAEPAPVDGSAELMAQLLDKLVDNAVSFAAEGTGIEVQVAIADGEVRLSVVNRGPLLPESMRHRLFDSLVSVRAGGGERAHLGLGLYIVTLIADFHRGRVEADNLDDGSGVRIGIVVPRAGAA